MPKSFVEISGYTDVHKNDLIARPHDQLGTSRSFSIVDPAALTYTFDSIPSAYHL